MYTIESSAPGQRDESADIAKGIGMLFVIGGHCGFELSNFISYSFHMPLFYFIAGFFLGGYVQGNLGSGMFIKKKVVSLLIPYFWYNLFFGLITFLLPYADINLQNSLSTQIFPGEDSGANTGILPFDKIINFHTLFVEPFISGHQFQISCPLWFVPSLFLVMLLVCLTRPLLRRAMQGVFWAIAYTCLLVAVYYISCNVTFQQNPLLAVGCRTVIGYIYCALGLLFYTKRRFWRPLPAFLLATAIYGVISIYYGNFYYSALANDYGTGRGRDLSLPLSICGIFIILSVSSMLVKYNIFVNKAGLILLGRSSYHIMAVHLSCFLLLNVILALILPGKHISEFTGIYFRYPNISFIYFIFAVCLCYFYVKFINEYLRWPGLKKLAAFWSRP